MVYPHWIPPIPNIAPALVAWLGVIGLLGGCVEEVVVERFENGSPKIVRYYTGSADDSASMSKEVGYSFKGRREYIVHFENGKRHGLHSEFWQNGQKKSETEYSQGLREGSWKSYFNNYTVAEEGAYEGDKKTGLWKGYWDDDSRKYEGNYKRDLRTGEWMRWNREGILVEKSTCLEGNREGQHTTFHPNGAIAQKYACLTGKPVGTFLELAPDGDTVALGAYDSSGRKIGHWVEYFSNGRPAISCGYRDGLRHDSLVRLRPDGSLWEKGYFETGDGSVDVFDSAGTLLETRQFMADKEHGEQKAYYGDGSLKSVILCAHGLAVETQKYHQNGAMAETGNFDAEGRRTGTWEVFAEDGGMIQSITYHEGSKHGPHKFWDAETGKLQRIQHFEHGYPSVGTIAYPGSD